MFLIKIYIKESYINYYHTIIQMCGLYFCIHTSCESSTRKDCFCEKIQISRQPLNVLKVSEFPKLALKHGVLLYLPI